MKKILSSFFVASLFFFSTVTPSFASSTLTVSNPRVVNNDFNIDIQISGAPDNICSWWNSLHNVYVVDLNGNRMHDFANCGYVTTDPDGTVHYTFSGAPQPPTGTYKIEVVEQEQNNYDVISDNTFDWISTINFPPSVQAPANAVLTPGQTYTGNGSFTDTDSTSWTATVNYGDGSGTQPLTLSGMNYSLNHTYTQNGGYQIIVTVTDEHGNNATATAQVHVELYDLSVSNPRLNSSGEFTIDLNVSAPDNVCSWWTIYHQAFTVNATTGQRHHDFANCSSNGGNNYTISGLGVLPAGTYKIEVLESEQPGLNGGSYDVISTNSFVWTNQSPQPASLNGGTINEGGTYAEIGSFIDVDSTSWTATVDYGDGSGEQSLTLNDKTFSLNHVYNSAGQFTVTVKVTDDQETTGTKTTTVTVIANEPAHINELIGASINKGDIYSENGSFTDNDSTLWTATINYGDGSGEQPLSLSGTNFTLSHQYTTAGDFTVTVKVTDNQGEVATKTTSVHVNAQPTLTTISGATITEGDSYTKAGLFTDVDSTSWNATVNYGDGSGIQPLALNSDKSFALNHLYKDNGTYTLTVVVTDNEGLSDTETASVQVNNAAPTVGVINAPINPVQANTAITASASFIDVGVLDTHTAVWNWGDGTTSNGTVTEANGSGSVSNTHSYTSAGVYAIALTITDNNSGATTQTFQYLTVYNPNAGWASGGKEFISPVGAVVGNSAATGVANFGFQVKYMNGDIVPSGKNFSLSFSTGNIAFTSTTYEWLVVNGDKATFKADGTLNGLPGYTVLVSVIDQSVTHDNGLIRVQIKDNNGIVVYDTFPGAIDTADPITSVTKGQIAVH